MATRETLTIDLPAETAKVVREAVMSGAYANAGDMIAAAVHLWEDQHDDELFGYTREELDRLVDEGIASGPGREVSIEEIAREGFRRAGVPYPEA